jgi:hypothetical protein
MKILMVCLGNICRSPLAEGIMKAKLLKFLVDSAEPFLCMKENILIKEPLKLLPIIILIFPDKDQDLLQERF